MNVGSSPYHAVQGLYCRASEGALLSIEGRSAGPITEHWLDIRTHVESTQPTTSTKFPSGVSIHTSTVDKSYSQSFCSNKDAVEHTHTVRELYDESKKCFVGLLSCQLPESDNDKNAFRDWFENFVLLETTLVPGSEKADKASAQYQTTLNITSLFETSLRNISSNDEWDIGRDLFIRRTLGFVARGKRIQMGVPAFPCKSPNTKKVGTHNPDMAERIALQTLHTFAQRVKKIYPPGVSVWVISDGHVFSDCIGVDDQEVLDYDQALQKLYQGLPDHDKDPEDIKFSGLIDMFFTNKDVKESYDHSWDQKFTIEHPIESERSTEAEISRQIMMQGCQSSREHFRKLLADNHPSTTSLYRGQARFMQDDLATPDFLAKSSKQKKKTSFAVAAEMIARNQAYSNLLELLLPNYVRLSIHAHTNKGPKFGICLFPREIVRAIDSVDNRHELVPAYEFQVPTPWHNSCIKVAGDNMTYVGKADIVRTAIESGLYEGGWVEGPEGGHFALTSTVSEPVISSSPVTESSSIVTEQFDEKKHAITQTKVMEVLTVSPVNEGRKLRFTIRIRGRLDRMFISPFSLVKRFTVRDSGNATA